MPSTSGIEIRPDSCVVVRARRRPETWEVSAVAELQSNGWLGGRAVLAAELQKVRKRLRLPRRAHLVIWPAGQDGGLSKAEILGAVVDAGFRARAVLSPAKALAVLAASRRRVGSHAGVAWLAINTHGATIAIVQGSDVLHERTLSWPVSVATDDMRQQLLQRYSIVSQLAPPLLQGIATVRETHGVPVEAVVTCGNIPELRSLTMPLIEELDLEVETLDSAEGLTASGTAADRVMELAPSIRLAAAAATATVRRNVTPPASRGGMVAAAVLLGAVGAVAAYGYLERSVVRSADENVIPDAASPVPAAAVTPPPEQAPAAAGPELRPPVAEAPGRPAESPRPVMPEPLKAEKEKGAAAPAARAADSPLPRLTSILIGQGRRLAILDGQIMAVGDTVGGRLLVRIEESAVILKDAAGHEVRVALKPGFAPEVEFKPLIAGAPGARRTSSPA